MLAAEGGVQTMTTKRITRLTGLLMIVLALCLAAQSGSASATAAGRAGLSRTESSAGLADQTYPDITATGCPEDGPVQATWPDQCVAIPSALTTIVSRPKGGGCVQNEYVRVEVPARLDYEAVWYSDIGLGTRWWSAPGTRAPHKVTGLGEKYKVPKGWSAWSGAGGSSASGDCTGETPGTFGTSGWAVVGCNTPRLRVAAVAGSDADSENWDIASVIQDQVVNLSQQINCHKAKKKSKSYKRWQIYAKHGRVQTTVTLPSKHPGKLKSRIEVQVEITKTGQQSEPGGTSKSVILGQAMVTVTRTGKVTVSIPLTSAGRSLVKRWLAGHRVDFTALASLSEPSLGWAIQPGQGSPPANTAFAGYEYANYVAVPESLSTSFVVPKVSCASDDAQAVYPEVGVENNTNTAGLVIGCNGKEAYYWPAVTMDDVVTADTHDLARPGDTIELGIAQGSTTTVSVTDETHTFTLDQSGAGNATGDDLTVGISGWYDPLQTGVADFGTLRFSKALLNGSAFGSFGTASYIYEYDLETSTGTPRTLQISTSKFGGNEESFSLVFKHS
jgi:hypothetical protein